jgi:plasmid stabilization system protein ParE
MISPGSSGTILLEDALDAATRFLDAVDESIEAICQMPHMGAQKPLKNPLLSGLRSWTVRDFETSSFFTSSQPDTLRVVRVLHGESLDRCPKANPAIATAITNRRRDRIV